MITANPSELFDGSIARAADEDLIELLRGGSDEALTVLFDRYHRLVFHVALRIVRDPGEAEEVSQRLNESVHVVRHDLQRSLSILRDVMLGATAKKDQC